MEAAVDEHPMLVKDQEASDALKLYFRYTAHYIVAARAFMRPDQVGLPRQIENYKSPTNDQKSSFHPNPNLTQLFADFFS
jgi:hypothetical protein